MAAAITDKLRKSAPRFSTTISSAVDAGVDTINVESLSTVPTDTAITVGIDRIDPVTKEATPAKFEVVTGVISGSSLVSCQRGQDGTTDQAHAEGAYVELLPTATDWNSLIEWALAQHNQDGSLKDDAIPDGAIGTAKLADGAATEEKIGAGAVTTGKVASGSFLKTHKLVWSPEATPRTISDGNPATVFPGKAEKTADIQQGSTLIIHVSYGYITFVSGIGYPGLKVRNTGGDYNAISVSEAGSNVSGIPMSATFVVENVDAGTWGFTPAARKDGDTSITIPGFCGVEVLIEEHLTGSS